MAIETGFKIFAPCQHACGFHFDRYDSFIHTPVISNDIRGTVPNMGEHFTVWLPALSDQRMIDVLTEVGVGQWHVFSRWCKRPETIGNIRIESVSGAAFRQSVAQSRGVLTSGGFQLPAEVLFLGKPLCAVPQSNQYEQLCNARALESMGAAVVNDFGPAGVLAIRDWVLNPVAPMRVDYPDESAALIEKIVTQAENRSFRIAV